MMIVAFTFQATAADTTIKEPKQHHHRVLGMAMIVGGVVLAGASAFVFSRGCPAQVRAEELGSVAGYCGPSYLQEHKRALEISTGGVGAGLIISGIFVYRK
jgi:hypothetical protein